MSEFPYYTDENGDTRVKTGCQVETASGVIKYAGDIIIVGKVEPLEYAKKTLEEEEANDGE